MSLDENYASLLDIAGRVSVYLKAIFSGCKVIYDVSYENLVEGLDPVLRIRIHVKYKDKDYGLSYLYSKEELQSLVGSKMDFKNYLTDEFVHEFVKTISKDTK